MQQYKIKTVKSPLQSPGFRYILQQHYLTRIIFNRKAKKVVH